MPADTTKTEQPSVATTVTFFVKADAEPGLLPRLLQPLAKRDLTPDGFTSRLEGDTIDVEMTLKDVPHDIVHLIEGNLRQIVGIRRVNYFKLHSRDCARPHS